MRKGKCLYWIVATLMFIMAKTARAQTVTGTEEWLQQAMERQGDRDVQDEEIGQDLMYLSEHPLDINTCQPADLMKISFLHAMHIRSFILYRDQLGPFREIYELQAIPGWTISLIRQIRPYLTTDKSSIHTTGFRYAWKQARSEWLFRYSRKLDSQESTGADTGFSRTFAGNPDTYLFRYRLQYQQSLMAGLLGEKDAGESFLRGASRYGFDFYSFHFFLRPKRSWIQSLALGDFTVNMGQGLMEWQTFSPGKGGDIGNMEKRSNIIRPYRSTGEYHFHRGLGFELARGRWGLAAFYSLRNLDANLLTDSLVSGSPAFSSFQTSGWHRTASELADRSAIRQTAFGLSITRNNQWGKWSLNAVRYLFSGYYQKSPVPYNLHAIQGRDWMNMGIDFSQTYKRVHLFGEMAWTSAGSAAYLFGSMFSLAPKADAGLVCRKIDPGYHSLHGSSFTERAEPSNEEGYYLMLTLRPSYRWQTEVFADMFRFPWLQYGVHAPVHGSEYGVRIVYKPSRKDEISLRIRSTSKWENEGQTESVIPAVSLHVLRSMRLHASLQLDNRFSFRSRVEMTASQRGRQPVSTGVLFYTDLFYKPLMSKFSCNFRMMLADTRDYDSRVYTYENDVAELTTIPAWSGRVRRSYINMAWKLSGSMQVWIKIGVSIKNNNELIYNQIEDNSSQVQADFRFQCRIQV